MRNNSRNSAFPLDRKPRTSLLDTPFTSKMTSQAAAIPSIATPAAAPAAVDQQASKPKPCCVCKEEKAKRDECMLFSNAADPSKDCLSTIDQYRACMK
ncbi:Cytochrome c oxidase copper chaperone, partial [Colletotrichum shisoi]